jgi:hypothetical protein
VIARDKRSRETISSEHEKAKALVRRARFQVEIGEVRDAEKSFREALGHLRRAFDWSDRDPELMHQLHRLGREIHNRFGCPIPYRDGTYYRECPVRLAHVPFGLSMGGTSKSVCSICGDDPFDCDHVKGRFYDHVVALRIGSICNVCLEVSCEHELGHPYDCIEAIHIVTEYRADEISIVPNPAQPDAVFLSLSISEREIRDQLDPDERESFEMGQELSCHHCVSCRD